MFIYAILYMLVGVIVFCSGGLAVYVLLRDRQYTPQSIAPVIKIPKVKQEKEDKEIKRRQEEEDYNAFYQ